MAVNLDNATVFMLILMRMTGLMVFSPIFGRRNVPSSLNVGFAFVLSLLLLPTVAYRGAVESYMYPMLFLLAKELVVGITAGVIMQLILSVIVIGGEIIDMQIGMSMAKAFDPGTNASISITSSVMNAMFLLIFFSTNNHLTFIKMMTQTFDIFPLGALSIDPQSFLYVPDFFSTIFILGMKLCLPIVIMELIITMAVGIIMKIIPQINIFVVNIQIKLIIGLFALTIFIVPLIGFMENLIMIGFERIGEAWRLML